MSTSEQRLIKNLNVLKDGITLAVIAIGIILLPANMYAQTLAFPGAEGFGKYTTGGRGGDVYIVTNLDDDGPGSLREGIEMDGARTIIFHISGTIELERELKINNGDLSIFGQTAPGEGIAISGHGTVIDADNVIIQYIRFRPGDIGGGEPDALWGRENTDIIIDHVSMSWSVDETGSFYDNENFTLQWSILSESLYESQHDKGRHGYGGIWGGVGATFHHNLLAHHTSRNPRFNGARYTTTPQTELVDYRNNVIYNWGDNSAYGGENGNHNMVANYYKPGPATPTNEKSYRILDAKPPSGDYAELGYWYIEENVVAEATEVNQDNWDGGVQRVNDSQMESMRVTEPFEAPELESFETAEQAFFNVLANAGAVLPKRDTLDRRIVQETIDGSATYGGIFGSNSGIIDSQNDVGGWPELQSETPPEDSDADGIPDAWETANDLDPENDEDASVITESGYSNLELYIHSINETGLATPYPGTPTLVYPADEVDIATMPTFRWSKSQFADHYQVVVWTGAGDFRETVIDSIVTDTTLVYPEDKTPLYSSESFYWEVRAVNETGAGEWTSNESFRTGTTTGIEEGEHPVKFELGQNYPNPFNPVTNISFQLPEAGMVSLHVYNPLGQRVAALVDDFRTAGSHRVSFDASHLASGSYFYRLSLNNRVITKKMMLIK